MYSLRVWYSQTRKKAHDLEKSLFSLLSEILNVCINLKWIEVTGDMIPELSVKGKRMG